MKRIFFILLFLAVSFISFADWKANVKEYWDTFEDYTHIINYLEKNFSNIPLQDRPAALGILAFSYNMGGNDEGEIRAVKKLFHEYNYNSISPEFLGLSGRIKIFDFIERWKKKFPGIYKIQIAKRDRLFCFFNPPKNIIVNMHSLAASEIEVKKLPDENGIKFFLNEGRNSISLPLKYIDIKKAETSLIMKIKCGMITESKQLILKKEYKYPGELIFFPEEANIRFTDRNFKPETYNSPSTETKKYFNKKGLLGKFVLPAGAGITLFLANRLIISPALNNNPSPQSGIILYSAQKSINILSAGLVVKGLIGFIKLFKTEKTTKILTKTDEKAVKYNKLLRRILKKKKKDVFVVLRLKISGSKK